MLIEIDSTVRPPSTVAATNVYRQQRLPLSVPLKHTGSPLAIPFSEIRTSLSLDPMYMYIMPLFANTLLLMIDLTTSLFSFYF